MYKVFFDNRTIYFTDQFAYYYKKYNGLFVRYLDEIQLAYVLELFRNVDEIKNVFIIHPDIETVFQAFRSFFRTMEAAGGLVFNEKGRILVIKRKARWDLPKGKLEKGEETQDSAIREVREECGITAPEIHSLLHVTYHAYSQEGVLILKKTYWYKMIYSGQKRLRPQTEEDITDARWISKKDLKMVVQNTYLSIVEVLKSANLL